jgi:hypothetical protein
MLYYCYCDDLPCFDFLCMLCYEHAMHLLCTNLGIAERQPKPGTCNGDSVCAKGHLAHAVLCYDMLCFALLCYVMLCYDMLWFAMLCYAML